MLCLHITVTPACRVYISLLHMHVMLPCDTCLYGFSIYLSYGLPCLLHVLLFHVPVFMIIPLFPVTDMDIPDTGQEKLLICDMWEAHIYCSRSRYIVHVILFMLYYS